MSVGVALSVLVILEQNTVGITVGQFISAALQEAISVAGSVISLMIAACVDLIVRGVLDIVIERADRIDMLVKPTAVTVGNISSAYGIRLVIKIIIHIRRLRRSMTGDVLIAPDSPEQNRSLSYCLGKIVAAVLIITESAELSQVI